MSNSNPTHHPCPICRSYDANAIFLKTGSKASSVFRCSRCTLVFHSTQTHDTAEFYKSAYFPEEFSTDWKESRSRLYATYLDAAEAYRKLSRILDIGSGFGFFLAEAKNRGFEVLGIEPSLAASEYCRKHFGVSVITQDLVSAALPADSFDVVTLWNVLDHLEDPMASLREIMRVLRPGGAVFIRLPNATFHVLVRRMEIMFHRIFHRKLDLSVIHRYAFGSKAIRYALTQAGFQKTQIANSKLSWSNPAEKGRPSCLKQAVLRIAEIGCTVVAALTANHALIGPSIFLRAEKPT